MKSLRNTSDTTEILTRLAALQQKSMGLWGAMNAHQAACHLADSFKLAMGLRVAPADPSLFNRTLMKWGALYIPRPWPKGVPTRDEVKQGLGGGGTPPGAFEQDRAELRALIERFAAPRSDFEWAKHPIFGTMSDNEWMRWGYLHADHHLRQFGS